MHNISRLFISLCAISTELHQNSKNVIMKDSFHFGSSQWKGVGRGMRLQPEIVIFLCDPS